MQNEWWTSFFTGLWLDAQRQARTEEETKEEATFIERSLRLGPASRVLDIPCGTGRLSIELASRGHNMTGVDLSLPFLVDAKRRSEELNFKISWEHMEMRGISWKEEFDAAFCFCGSFGYFDDEGNLNFLKAAARALKPGGRMLIDTHVLESLLYNFQERSWSYLGKTLLLEERHYDHIKSRINSDWIIVYDGKTDKKQISIRMYSYKELLKLFKDAGFSNFEAYSSVKQEPFKLGSKRLYLIASKSF